MHVDVTAVRTAWQAGIDRADQQIAGLDAVLQQASGADLGDLAPATSAAVERLTEFLDIAHALVQQTHDQVEACLADFVESDGESAGSFTRLRSSP